MYHGFQVVYQFACGAETFISALPLKFVTKFQVVYFKLYISDVGSSKSSLILCIILFDKKLVDVPDDIQVVRHPR